MGKQRSIFQTKKPITICDNCQKRNNSFQALSTSAMRIEKSNQNYSKLSIIFKILPDLQWSKQKPIKKNHLKILFVLRKTKKCIFLNKMTLEKSFWSQNQQ